MKTLDRRCLRTRLALQDALAQEIHATGDLARVTVTGVTERANVTRRTFYSHYKDIPALVRCIEDETIEDLAPLAQRVSQVTLPQLEEAIHSFEPSPGATDVLAYFREHGNILSALLGKGGDPAFVERIKDMVSEVVQTRALDGFSTVALAAFDYYLTFVVSAEVGVLVRWLTTGMKESDYAMVCIMTAMLFIRPGDLYGRPIELDIPSLVSAAATQMEENDNGTIR
ncbi:MAG: TetR-like C-terminal domain-containing protein [Coriobacteriales bacterium]|nr:TetR-like C-terminal domain-containing protein [Coriobacteriales bacterium]